MATIAREIIFDLLFEEILGTSKENRNEVEMKFTFEREWIKAVKRARYRSNYGMGNMNSGLEELSGNKLDWPVPWLTATRSKATSLTSPVVLFSHGRCFAI